MRSIIYYFSLRIKEKWFLFVVRCDHGPRSVQFNCCKQSITSNNWSFAIFSIILNKKILHFCSFPSFFYFILFISIHSYWISIILFINIFFITDICNYNMFKYIYNIFTKYYPNSSFSILFSLRSRIESIFRLSWNFFFFISFIFYTISQFCIQILIPCHFNFDYALQ